MLRSSICSSAASARRRPNCSWRFAFINEVIDKMDLEPLRDRLHYLVEKRFRGELSKCVGCKMCQ